ncbi:LysR family transcriptional regulator [Kibdelosporangium philippinense]|uniref:LysR family transcriptional regulator n=1 Tax=Kibdelosporangium philippinense TaxID=211113 RepID=A0ABS8Z4R4_9PSEU|nr:LysR family transcriptional regulator [Kibdelosporangium philippinense]MCE7002914.1 LysR family transcriptional regulator [Kibdelosporangium philippinense]
MELREVETFLVLADELHFGRAADRLHVTQGRVSQLIRALEREIGGALFERTSRTVRLTALGEKFHDGARHGFDSLISALTDCQVAAHDVQVELSVGYMPSIGAKAVTRIVTAFEHRHPGFTVKLRAMVNFDIGSAGPFAAQDTDIKLVWSPGGDGKAIEAPGRTVGPVLHQVRRGVIVPSGHPLTEFKSISIERLVGYPLLSPSNSWPTELLDSWIPDVTPSGVSLHRLSQDIPQMAGRTVLTVEDALTSVARGHGLHVTVSTALDRLAFPGLSVVPIHDMPPMVVVPIWRTSARNAAIRSFVDTARDVSFNVDD